MKSYFLILYLFITPIVFAQTTLIPDINFELALISNGYDVAPPNGSVPTSNISSATHLFCSYYGISDFTGIQDFVSLKKFVCYHNSATSLDLSQNTLLTYLNCEYNDLTDLNISQNYLLDTLYCGMNQLASLDVSNNPNLITFGCLTNQLTSIDVSNNISLKLFGCSENQLSSIDLSNNPNLLILSCGDNQIPALNLSNNLLLTSLYCERNLLTSLNLSQHSFLINLHCYENNLECLNIKNGNNIYFDDFYAFGNPNLSCITVDNIAWSNTNWTVANQNIDPQMLFNTNCGTQCALEVNELSNHRHEKVAKIIDVFGREIKYEVNKVMIYLYEDGSSEKRFVIE
jgi:hypothetical protein